MCAAGDREPGRCWCRAWLERCSCRESSVNALARAQNIAGGTTRSTVRCSRHEPPAQSVRSCQQVGGEDAAPELVPTGGGRSSEREVMLFRLALFEIRSRSPP